MKKNISIVGLLILFVIPYSLFPQFLRGVGVYGAETSSRDGYRNTNPIDNSPTPSILHVHPPSHRGGEHESWGVGIFLEMLPSEMWRWRTEIEYANKGSKENELLNPFTNAQQAGTNTSKRIQWNNYLKRYIDLGLKFPTYALIGVRAEYTLANSAPAYNYIAGGFRKLSIGADAGLGIEIPLKRGWSLFVEEHYNPDVLPKYSSGGVFVWSRMWETRIGVIFRWKRGIGAYDIDCNAPRYHGR